MASVSDLTYDLLTVLQSKLEACAAYDMYMKDVQQAGDKEAQNLLTRLKSDNERHIEEWVAKVERQARGQTALVGRRSFACDITNAES